MISLLQTAPAPGGAAGGLVQFLPMIFIFVIFYFLLIAPMRKKQKKAQEMLSKLKKGEAYTFFCSFPGHSSIMKGAFKF